MKHIILQKMNNTNNLIITRAIIILDNQILTLFHKKNLLKIDITFFQEDMLHLDQKLLNRDKFIKILF